MKSLIKLSLAMSDRVLAVERWRELACEIPCLFIVYLLTLKKREIFQSINQSIDQLSMDQSIYKNSCHIFDKNQFTNLIGSRKTEWMSTFVQGHC